MFAEALDFYFWHRKTSSRWYADKNSISDKRKLSQIYTDDHGAQQCKYTLNFFYLYIYIL